MPSRVQLVGLPYDATSTFLRGAAAAPQAIRAELLSPAGHLWAEDLQDLAGPGLFGDAGDIDLSRDEPGQARDHIQHGVAQIIAEGARPIALGGDHAVTWPVVRAVSGRHGPLTILHIDAHPDLYDEFDGDQFTHASPFARILEEQLAARLVQVGIRCLNGHQQSQVERYGVEIIDMRAWARGVRPSIDGGNVYLSIDLDGIDPAHAPGVSHREPGGLTVREVIGMVQDVGGTLVGADVVELNPSRDRDAMTARVAAKLVKELASRMTR
jgi:arginase